jgi:hypothetical protein
MRNGQTVKEKKRVSRRYLCTLLHRLDRQSLSIIIIQHIPGITREQKEKNTIRNDKQRTREIDLKKNGKYICFKNKTKIFEIVNIRNKIQKLIRLFLS